MTATDQPLHNARRFAWWLLFGALVVYVAVRMGAFALDLPIETVSGPVRVSNTFATVDHPFHVARAETLWHSLAAGDILRWISQHQGGYPVEFYPLGEAWLEVGVRAASLGSFSAGGAHTLAVLLIFLLPGLGFVALARIDGFSPAAGFLAMALHVALPGGWYHGGYTELVQWGLVTNVAAAVAAFLMFPALLRHVSEGAGWAGALAALLAAAAISCNPRSLVALLALGVGAWIGALISDPQPPVARASGRLTLVALATALLAAPELLALARFRGLYTFVHYSGYAQLGDYAAETLAAVGWPVVVLACVGLVVAFAIRRHLALRSTAAALVVYVALTAFVAFAPLGVDLAAQLEPTRLMPVQRLLTLYLAASTIVLLCAFLVARVAPRERWIASSAAAAIGGAVLLIMTRPLPGPPPDPASPLIPPVGLYPVERAAQPAQIDLEAAVRLADAEAEPGTAIVILGSAISWHQPLWAPVWTERPLYYDNWLWYWHAHHAGTPGYQPLQGHHYPDPAMTLEPSYLERHGIGAVVVTGQAREAAVVSPLLRPLLKGTYDAYLVRDPTTTITFDGDNAARGGGLNEWFWAEAATPEQPVTARLNWFPRWSAAAGQQPIEPVMRDDGYMEVSTGEPLDQIVFRYEVQPLDWLARALAVGGLLMALALSLRGSGAVSARRRWYPQKPKNAEIGPAEEQP